MENRNERGNERKRRAFALRSSFMEHKHINVEIKNGLKFNFLNKFDSSLPESLKDIANLKRLHKYLFDEFILNENAVKEAHAFIEILVISIKVFL